MAAPSKTKKIESLAKLLQKRHKGLPGSPERAVLEHLVYAALLENATYEQADSAMTVLEHHFIDWNEVRVSTIGELADVFSMLPDPKAAGERVRLALQGIFEKTYQFDLEDLRKKGKNLSQAVGFLESVSACSRFMIDYTSQVAFGGHVIPLDEASLRVFRLLGLTQVNKEGTREEVPGLERAIAKKNGPAFSSQLHHFAAGFFVDPESVELRTLLKPIDPEALKRDWTPPILTLPKAQEKTPSKSVAPLVATLPFVASDEDDFDDDHGGTEAEFISDDESDAVEQPVHRGKAHLPIVAAVHEESEKEKKPVKEKADKKPAVVDSALKSTRKTPVSAEQKKDTPVKEKKKPGQNTTSKDDNKKKTAKKKAGPPKKVPSKPPTQSVAKRTPTPKESGKKDTVKKVTTKTPKKGADKSPTRQLREKKPK